VRVGVIAKIENMIFERAREHPRSAKNELECACDTTSTTDRQWHKRRRAGV
jgi:hypothetical protein